MTALPTFINAKADTDPLGATDTSVSFPNELDNTQTRRPASLTANELPSNATDRELPSRVSDVGPPPSVKKETNHTLSRSGSTLHSSRNSTDIMGMRSRDGPRCLRRVPFEVQVIVTLMVPVLCLVGVVSSIVANADAEYRFINARRELFIQMKTFQNDLMEEASTIGRYLTYANGTNRSMNIERTYTADRERTDEAWRNLLNEIASFANDDLLVSARNNIIDAMLQLPLTRDRVRNYVISGTEARRAYVGIGIATQGIMRAIIKHDRVGSSLREVSIIQSTRRFVDAITLVHACGRQLLAVLETQQPVAPALLSEFDGAVLTWRDTQLLMLDLVTGEDLVRLQQFVDDESTRELRRLANQLLREVREIAASTPAPGALGPAEAGDELLDDEEFDFDVTSGGWGRRFVEVIDRLEEIELRIIRDRLGATARNTVGVQVAVMVVTVLLSAACAGFIVYWQVRIARNMAQQQLHAAHVSRVVSSFVPKAFLRTMGTRSIMQIQTGQHVNVATTMLFSDIRSFTTLSERMSNERLFLWLQKYFALMTRVNDRHSGTIDKLIGDAIFSFFSATGNAIKCAIDMQSVVAFLNSTLPSNSLVQLGVGLHHGVVAFGVFGDETRRTCTMVSSEVNMASRLEGLTKFYGVRIIVSQTVIDQIDVDSFHHDVLNPMSLAQPNAGADDVGGGGGGGAAAPSGMAARLAAANAAYRVKGGGGTSAAAAAVTESVEQLGGASDEDEGGFAADYENAFAAQGQLAHRLLGEVAVKGSSRQARIYEVFQADEVFLRKYKAQSRPMFEEAVRLQLQLESEEEKQLALSAHASEYNATRHTTPKASMNPTRVTSSTSSPRHLIEQPVSLTALPESDQVDPHVPVAGEEDEQQGNSTSSNQLKTLESCGSAMAGVKGLEGLDSVPVRAPSESLSKAALALRLLERCDEIARSLGVEDSVILVKRVSVNNGKSMDIFEDK